MLVCTINHIKETAMPRFGSTDTTTDASSASSQQNGQLKFHWSFSYEFDLPGGNQSGAGQGAGKRTLAGADELGARLDKALAFAG
jgi:hypothetical protein